MAETVAVIPLTISRGLTDKLVEKRKGAALELEKYYNITKSSSKLRSL